MSFHESPADKQEDAMDEFDLSDSSTSDLDEQGRRKVVHKTWKELAELLSKTRRPSLAFKKLEQTT